MKQWNSICWTNPEDKVSEHFTVKEALWLNKWGRLATEADGLTTDIKFSICRTAAWMDEVREILNKPVYVKSWLRPVEYNKEIGGAKHSMHMEGRAVDFWLDVNGDEKKDTEDCDLTKEMLKNWLVKLELRMEDNRGGNWVHLDDKKPLGARFFRP